MADPVDYVPFETTTSASGAASGGAELERLHDVPVELAVEIGRTHMTIRETRALGPGSIVTLNRPLAIRNSRSAASPRLTIRVPGT